MELGMQNRADPLKNRRHSYPRDKHLTAMIKHDSFFNPKKKAAYESELAELTLHHLTPFMPIIKKVSEIVLADIYAHFIDNHVKQPLENNLSYKFHQFFINDFDLSHLFDSALSDDDQFYHDICLVLQSEDPGSLYQHMCIQFSYVRFFMQGDIITPETMQAMREGWCQRLNLEKFISDTKSYRHDDVLFKNYQRLNRNYITNKTTQDLGIHPPEEYDHLPEHIKFKLMNKAASHQSGKLRFFMTTACDTTAEAMYVYDLPQLCGPSGTTAIRLALANQAVLSNEEMELMQFIIAVYNVSIGAHSIDECYIIAKDQAFNHYIRGDYTSMIPHSIKTKREYHELWLGIQSLNEKYNDILICTPPNKINEGSVSFGL